MAKRTERVEFRATPKQKAAYVAAAEAAGKHDVSDWYRDTLDREAGLVGSPAPTAERAARPLSKQQQAAGRRT